MSASAATITRAFFSITGDFITEKARDFVLEKRFDQAVKFLQDTCPGMSLDQAFEILKGNKKLVGENQVDFVDDDDQDWKSELADMFSGMWITPQGRFMRPYAVVTSWGPEDMRHADRLTSESDSLFVRNRLSPGGQEYMGRNLFYARDERNDVAKLVRLPADVAAGIPDHEGQYAVLFAEERNVPALLITVHKTAQEAADAFLKDDRTLSRVGYEQQFPREIYKVRFDSRGMTKDAPLVTTGFRLNEVTQEDATAIGRFRAHAIDAERRKMTMADFDEYWRIINDKGEELKTRTAAMMEMIRLQPKLEENIPAWRKAIIEQAGDNWLELEHGGKTYRFPRAPFEHWCLRRTAGRHLAMPWEPVCSQGLKLIGDDPYHSDFLIGAGLSPDSMLRDKAFSDAVYQMRFALIGRMLTGNADVLSGGGIVIGRVLHPTRDAYVPSDAIVVLPSASPVYLEVALKAAAVIVEQGGAMAHLVNVAREHEKLIVRVENARKRFPAGREVTIDAGAGTVTLAEDYDYGAGSL
ncbi:MAG: hypothetical protein K2X45_07995 [Phreatobacter sp.]|nr:hypothetical protein [Phreatobacter sp.]